MNENVKPSIYGLVEVRKDHQRFGEIRYVGQTVTQLNERLRMHIWEAKKEEKLLHLPKNRWINKLSKFNLFPKIILVQELNNRFDLNQAEIYWISYFKSIGCDLLNANAGGGGSKPIDSIVKMQELNQYFSKYDLRIKDTEWKGSRFHYTFVCPQNHESQRRVDQAKKIPECSQCKGTYVYHSLEECKELAQKYNAKCLSTEYPKKKQPLVWQCNNGHIWKSRMDTIRRAIRYNSFCPWCGGHGRGNGKYLPPSTF